MQFHVVSHRQSEPTRWSEITHLRISEKVPDSPHAIERRKVLRKLADANGTVPISKVLAELEPVRKLQVGRERSIKSDLRNWSNSVNHGNNSRDKGWLELGYIQ